ncbi:MAG: protein kinase [Pseudomonadales bacterium]|nr:protein kinase [Pseudomonadales bacterium]MDP6471043.1 protein kinase [Pseudomonadales bacterium]MDP6825771.1 protein kinase [Pseudomonadales bacterium]MDP6970235.1 protein kinase [Pseudomonadales bacterium]
MIVHSGFKPGNVFVSPSYHTKILDFGIARAVQINRGHGEDTVFDPSNLAVFTPAYVSREILHGDNPKTRDDIYCLGIVIYLILTGHHPFGRLSAEDACCKGLSPEKTKRLNARQWRGLKKCLSFQRAERPSSVSELKSRLFEPAPWRSRTVLVAGAAFFLVLAGSMLWTDPEISEVREEVRHATLVDARVARLTALVPDPVLDERWQQLVWAQTQTLLALSGATQTTARLFRSLTALYAERMGQSETVDEAAALYQMGSRYGDLSAQYERLLASQRAETSAPLSKPDHVGFAVRSRDRLEELARNFKDAPERQLVIKEAFSRAGMGADDQRGRRVACGGTGWFEQQGRLECSFNN